MSQQGTSTVRSRADYETGSVQPRHRSIREIASDPELGAHEAAWECARAYARERPEVVAMWTFGVGFLLGWRLRLW